MEAFYKTTLYFVNSLLFFCYNPQTMILKRLIIALVLFGCIFVLGISGYMLQDCIRCRGLKFYNKRFDKTAVWMTGQCLIAAWSASCTVKSLQAYCPINACPFSHCGNS